MMYTCLCVSATILGHSPVSATTNRSCTNRSRQWPLSWEDIFKQKVIYVARNMNRTLVVLRCGFGTRDGITSKGPPIGA